MHTCERHQKSLSGAEIRDPIVELTLLYLSLMVVFTAVQLFYKLSCAVTQMATPLITVLPKTLLP